jgi:hypothetical protein
MTPETDTETPASPSPTREATGRARPGRTWLLVPLLAILLCLASGAVGGLLILALQARPAPGPRFAVIDTSKILEAVAEASKRDDGLTRRWPERFDLLVEKLQAEDPDRLILVREAVVSKELEDVTPVFLRDLAGGDTPAPRARRPNVSP